MKEYLLPILTASVFLIIISIIDLKTFNKLKGGIPSFLTTAFIIAIFIMTLPQAVVLALLGGLFAIFFVDVGLYKGLPDIKVLIAVSMALFSVNNFLLYLGIMLLMGAVTQFAILRFTKIEKEKGEMPYIPIMALAYFVMVGIILSGGGF